jgi:hypothetical protein
MIEAYALSALALAAAGIILALLAVISVKIRREDTAYKIMEPTTDRLATWVRSVNGVYVRNPGMARQELPRLVGQNVAAPDVMAR